MEGGIHDNRTITKQFVALTLSSTIQSHNSFSMSESSRVCIICMCTCTADSGNLTNFIGPQFPQTHLKVTDADMNRK